MTRLGERAGLVGLAAFVAIDVLLVGIAVNSTRTPVVDGGQQIGTSSVGASSRPSSTTTTTAFADAKQPDVKVAPLSVGIVGVDEDTAFRFTVGSCPGGGAKIELTSNAGTSWGPRSAKFDALVRIRVRDNGSAFSVGASADNNCSPSIRQASKYDADWGDATAVNNAWYRDPRDEHSVGLPTGGTGKPCGSKPVVDLAVIDSGAAALCEDGTVLVSKTGATWNQSATVPGALALALDDKSRSLAVVPGTDGCRGLAVVDADKPDAALGCVETDLAKVKAGTVALSVTGSTGWLRVGGAVFRAGSDLKTWKQA
jgi:hypothetical protein